MLIDITQDTVVNNTASVKVTFEPPECLLSEPSCVSYYRIFYRKANSTEDQVIRRFNKTDAVEADIKPQRMVSLAIDFIRKNGLNTEKCIRFFIHVSLTIIDNHFQFIEKKILVQFIKN